MHPQAKGVGSAYHALTPDFVYHLYCLRIIVYHGPVGDAVPFFTSLGFVCPPRKDVPSFLQVSVDVALPDEVEGEGGASCEASMQAC